MTDPAHQSFTQLLQSARVGKTEAGESLLELAYAELGELARVHFGPRRPGHTLQPTALVHEAWLKLAGHLGRIEDRQHFFAVASRAMRQVLADHARTRKRKKRGGDRPRVTLDQDLGADGASEGIELVDLDDTLSRLFRLNERHARVVELRIFGGLTVAEVADELHVSLSTVEKDWFMARAWLHTELSRAG